MEHPTFPKNLKEIDIENLWESYPNKDKIPGKTIRDKKRKFKEIIKSFNFLSIKFIVDTGYALILPKRVGRFIVVKRKSGKKKYVDLNFFQKTGIKRYHSNKHSEGYYARFKWLKRSPYSLVNNRSIYKFTPFKVARSYLANCIKNRNTIHHYYEDE